MACWSVSSAATSLEAERRKGSTGVNLLQLLESRLDNVVYRMGFGSTAPKRVSWSRTAGITVNGEVVNIAASFREGRRHRRRPREGQEAAARHRRLQAGRVHRPAGLGCRWTAASSKACSRRPPDRDEFGAEINESLIVELYSR